MRRREWRWHRYQVDCQVRTTCYNLVFDPYQSLDSAQMHFFSIVELLGCNIENKQVAILGTNGNSRSSFLKSQISQCVPLSNSRCLGLQEDSEVVFGVSENDFFVVGAADKYLPYILSHDLPVDWRSGQFMSLQMSYFFKPLFVFINSEYLLGLVLAARRYHQITILLWVCCQRPNFCVICYVIILGYLAIQKALSLLGTHI